MEELPVSHLPAHKAGRFASQSLYLKYCFIDITVFNMLEVFYLEDM